MDNSSSYPPVILITGKVGSGKGTQARMIAKELGYEVYSTGDEFRRLRERDDFIGHRVRDDYDAGKWMPYWFASYLMMQALLSLSEKKGIVFEGTGRKLQEAQLLHEIMEWLGQRYAVVYLDISDETAIARVAQRARGDGIDTPEMTRARLDEYAKHTVPVLDFFRDKNLLKTVKGERPIDDVYQDVKKAILG